VNRKRTLRRLRFRAQMRLDALMARVGLVRLERVNCSLTSVAMHLGDRTRDQIDVALSSRIASTPGTDAADAAFVAALREAREWDDAYDAYYEDRFSS
jgi:hypothetical protein